MQINKIYFVASVIVTALFVSGCDTTAKSVVNPGQSVAERQIQTTDGKVERVRKTTIIIGNFKDEDTKNDSTKDESSRNSDSK